MKNKGYFFSLILTGSLVFTSCTRSGDATEQSPNMGAENAEGGTTPHVSSAQDSAARSRQGGAAENSGLSQPLDSNHHSTPHH